MYLLINLAIILINLDQFEALKCAECSIHCARDDQHHPRRKCVEKKNHISACSIFFDIKHEMIDTGEIAMKTNVTLKGTIHILRKHL